MLPTGHMKLTTFQMPVGLKKIVKDIQMNQEQHLHVRNALETSLAPIWERLFSIEEMLFKIHQRIERIEVALQRDEPKK